MYGRLQQPSQFNPNHQSYFQPSSFNGNLASSFMTSPQQQQQQQQQQQLQQSSQFASRQSNNFNSSFYSNGGSLLGPVPTEPIQHKQHHMANMQHNFNANSLIALTNGGVGACQMPLSSRFHASNNNSNQLALSPLSSTSLLGTPGQVNTSIMNNSSVNSRQMTTFGNSNSNNNKRNKLATNRQSKSSNSNTTKSNSETNQAENGTSSSGDTNADAYIQKLKTCIDANRRNINQRFNTVVIKKAESQSSTPTTKESQAANSDNKRPINQAETNETQNSIA